MPAPQPPRLLDRVRHALRLRHMSPRTEEAYVAWIRRFILFHEKRHPSEMGSREVIAFLLGFALLAFLVPALATLLAREPGRLLHTRVQVWGVAFAIDILVAIGAFWAGALLLYPEAVG
jgi:hypothetical protein